VTKNWRQFVLEAALELSVGSRQFELEAAFELVKGPGREEWSVVKTRKTAVLMEVSHNSNVTWDGC
jgi:hypothetical protein